MSDDEKPDGMQIVKVGGGRYAVFTKDGDYLATLPYGAAMPLILKPDARREFLAEHIKELQIKRDLMEIELEKIEG